MARPSKITILARKIIKSHGLDCGEFIHHAERFVKEAGEAEDVEAFTQQFAKDIGLFNEHYARYYMELWEKVK